jgi:hypothetical protein
MLRDGRMAGLVKLRQGMDMMEEGDSERAF